jgi:hypothetical protein
MLVEHPMVEQRYDAFGEVLDGTTLSDAATPSCSPWAPASQLQKPPPTPGAI